MKRRVVTIILAVTLLALSALGYAYLRNKTTANQQNTEQSRDAPAVSNQPVTPAPAGQPGAYIDYSDQAISQTAGTKILFFHAPWCPQCRSLEKSIESTKLPDGVTIIKVDYDSNQALRQKYGVTLQTTFVKVDDNGELIKKYVAYNEPVFDSVKRNLID